MQTLLMALASGLLFGAGLVISGMTDTANVLGFLRLDAHWNPALAFVMGGGLAVTLPGFALLRHWQRPRFAERFVMPTVTSIDRRLLLGAALFGAGWGLAGFCPGPAWVAASQLLPSALWFIPAMFIGAWIANRIRI